jgi:hypothetical protein
MCSDGRQSETAAAIQRGVGRMLRGAGFACVPELSLANGRRADVLALGRKGEDLDHRDQVFTSRLSERQQVARLHGILRQVLLCHTADMDPSLIDEGAGLIIADAWGADIVRDAAEDQACSARRKAVTLLVARTAAMRLHSATDPNADSLL